MITAPFYRLSHSTHNLLKVRHASHSWLEEEGLYRNQVMPVLWSPCLVIHRGEYSLRAADIKSGLSGTSQNQSGILVRHQDKKGTVKEGTREREARFLNQGTEVQALLPVRILGLLGSETTKSC